jgi:hypothetical protein
MSDGGKDNDESIQPLRVVGITPLRIENGELNTLEKPRTKG